MNKVFLEHRLCACLSVIHSCFRPAMTEPTSCDRDHVVHKVSVFIVYAVVERFVEPSLTQSKGRPSTPSRSQPHIQPVVWNPQSSCGNLAPRWWSSQTGFRPRGTQCFLHTRGSVRRYHLRLHRNTSLPSKLRPSLHNSNRDWGKTKKSLFV